MPQYNYKCNICNHEYYEVRDVTDPQWFNECPVDGCAGNLTEVSNV